MFHDQLIIFGAKYLIIISAAAAVWFWLKQPRERQKQIIVFAVITLPLTYLVAKIASLAFYDPRPFVTGHFTPLIQHAADNGFPSDHTLFAGALAAVVCCFNKKTGLVLFLIAGLVGAGRVAAGIHSPTDVLGSLFIAIVVAYLIFRFILPAAIRSKTYNRHCG